MHAVSLKNCHLNIRRSESIGLMEIRQLGFIEAAILFDYFSRRYLLLWVMAIVVNFLQKSLAK